MATINVRRDVTDPFYRYKLERLQSKIEGKGNGIKTVIVNLTSVASSLARPPACASFLISHFPLLIPLPPCAELTGSQMSSSTLASSWEPRQTPTPLTTAGSSTE